MRRRYKMYFWEQTQNENEDEDNSKSLEYYNCVCLKSCCFGYQCMIILLLIIESIISIVVCTNNQDQAQIYYAVLINVLIQIISIPLFLFIIRSSIKFQDKLKQFCTQEQIKNFIIDDQKQHVPIHYFIIYTNIIQLLLVIQFKGKTKSDCSYSYCESYYAEPKLSGNYTESYADAIYFQIAFILCYEFFFGILAFYFPRKKYEQLGEKMDKKSNKKYSCILLSLFFCYSCFKIIIYIVFLSIGEYSSSNILLLSNILFHIIMILICIRAYYLISQDKQCGKQDYFNYFTPVSDILMDDELCILLLFFCGLTLIVTLASFGYKNNIDDTQEVINWNYFIIFDCFAVQILTMLIIIYFFIFLPCRIKFFTFKNKQTYQKQKINQQQIQRNVESQEEKTKKLKQKIQNKLSPYILKVKLQGNNDCTICLQKMIEDEQQIIVQLKCHKTHIFHLQCIQKWLKQHRKCPICNKPQQQF